MIFSRKQVISLLRPSPYFCGFEDFVYEFRIISSEYAVAKLHTCRNNRDTFVEVANSILKQGKHKLADEFSIKVLGIAQSFDGRPILIPVFVHCGLKKRWPEQYPSNSNVPDDALIVEDGNTRLSALAVRYIQKLPTIRYLGIFIGHHP